MTVARVCVVIAVLALVAPGALPAQRASRSARPPVTSRRDVRAELATTLLNANRFGEAAAEFRLLVAAEPANHAYRLGLARALAWGNHPREAEHELLLARDRQNADVVDPLLRSVRSAFDPTAAQAAVWVREAPRYVPYRLAFARALAHEDPRRSIAQFDTLRFAALAGDTLAPPGTALIREQADAYVAFGARTSAILLLGAGVNQAPSDTGLRHTLAGLLYDAGSFAAARAAYDTLVGVAPAGWAYLGRATAALALHDTAAAQIDLGRSVDTAPSYDAYYLLASLARSHEDFMNARAFYDAARRVAPDASSRGEIAAATAELAREQRPGVGFAPDAVGIPGWRAISQSSVDNAGISFVSMDASRTDELSGGFLSDLDIGARRIGRGGLGALTETGASASVGLARRTTAGRAMFDAAVHGGFVTHPGIASFGSGSLSLAGWFDAWELGVDLSREPAYESLFTPDVLSLPGGETPALIAKTTRFSTGGPLGPIDAGAGWARSWLSDGNASESFDTYARLPLSGALFAVYQGSVVSYAAPARLYWDPVHYVSNAIGPELAMRHSRGLSLAARVLAGYATDVERDTTTFVVSGGGRQPPPIDDQRLIRRTAVQLSTAGEASYRASGWEGAVDAAYGRGRTGAYQRMSVTATLRVLR